MDSMKIEENVLEHQEELEIYCDQNGEQIYPMDGIKVDKGFYSVFELDTSLQIKELYWTVIFREMMSGG